MCQYSSTDGMPNDWHFVHLGSRAVGGAGLVMVEATAVSPEGRISSGDTGIWSDAHAEAFERITAFIKGQGAVPAIQLAHAGRKASTDAPWRGSGFLREAEGGWQTIAPSPVPFREGETPPHEMSAAGVGLDVTYPPQYGRAWIKESTALPNSPLRFIAWEMNSAHLDVNRFEAVIVRLFRRTRGDADDQIHLRSKQNIVTGA